MWSQIKDTLLGISLLSLEEYQYIDTNIRHRKRPSTAACLDWYKAKQGGGSEVSILQYCETVHGYVI